MRYYKSILLKDGRTCVLRSGTADDAQAVLDNFRLTHAQTDWLSTYPEEITFTAEQEERFLQAKADSDGELELLAEVDGRIVGTAGIDRAGRQEKLRHRAIFGASVDRAYWGLGIGRAMLRACIENAKAAGYAQLELAVIADNARAIALYETEGFVEYGRNPKGMRTRDGVWQTLVEMRRELDETEQTHRDGAFDCTGIVHSGAHFARLGGQSGTDQLA